MLADAISAETFKLTKNWRTSFFAFLFLPLAGLLVGLLSEFWLEEAFNPNEGGPSLPDLLPFDFAQAVIGAIQQAANPLTILWIAIPLTIQTLLIFGITYLAARLLRFTYEDAAPSAMIGASNHFEVAIATAVMLFGLNSGAALATVVGVLIEVPLMLFLVRVCQCTRGWFTRA